MPSKNDQIKGKQVNVSLDHSSEEAASEQLIADNSNQAPSFFVFVSDERSIVIFDFSNAQVNSLILLMKGLLDDRLNRRFESSSFDSSPNSASLVPESTVPSPSPPKQLRAEEVNYFDPKYKKETVKNALVVNAEKHVFYRDVYVFVDRLKDLAV